ncbi:hypothetical protein TrRE_jg964 [Triparma retinervis]|uniref:Uncharacterized protein n=1 Tax=Triparma retinervis TaxID=2557542 RepID=A0A9W7G2D1_9STRA|nr:hypothetical protein TrRE_jg964 [Triparma retinervis]
MEAFRQRAFALLFQHCGDWLLDFNQDNVSILKTSLLKGKIALEDLKVDLTKVNEALQRRFPGLPLEVTSAEVSKVFLEFNFATLLDFLTKPDSKEKMRIVIEDVKIEVGVMSEDLSIDVPSFNVKIPQQALSDLAALNSTFRSLRLHHAVHRFRPSERPSSRNCRDWWRYAAKAVLTRRRSNRGKTCWSNFRNVLRLRKGYKEALEEAKREPGDEVERRIKDIEEVRVWSG